MPDTFTLSPYSLATDQRLTTVASALLSVMSFSSVAPINATPALVVVLPSPRVSAGAWRGADEWNTVRSAVQDLANLAALESDWDSYGASPITTTAVETAQALLSEVHRRFGASGGARLAPTDIMPLRNGGVQMDWQAPDIALELRVGPQGAIQYLLIHDPDGEERYEQRDQADWSNALSAIYQVLTDGECA